MSENMKIWEQLCTTDPVYTKNFTRGGGFSGTAINPTYVNRKLTELFGPAGTGWKFVVDGQWFQNGHSEVDDNVHNQHVIHIICGHIEYKVGEQWASTGQQFGQTAFVGKNARGWFTDEEAPKKSVTDCISKCAALLGASADIYLGNFDGNKYVNTPDEKPAATLRKRAATAKKDVVTIPASLNDAIEVINGLSDGDSLLSFFNSYRSSESMPTDAVSIKRLCKAVQDKASKVSELGSPVRALITSGLKAEQVKFNAAAAT